MTVTAWSGRPVPQPTELSQPYWDAALRGELLYLRCGQCGTAFFPPLGACVVCRSADVAWQRSKGRGTVYSYTVLHDAPSAGFPVPSVLAIIEVDEGYPMFSSVVGCPPGDVRIGLRVQVSFEELTAEINLPVFRPVDAEERA
ncbi:Zn-ribbon domain-containing OB-fold protein [Frankia sp. Cas4]|uniref:Zn-ribbon domain-containing OB-fold protein n=1 Tax=Frankia sp. Cas4 TaxID=3073927 RepID=UPI002AD539AC|nr:Zn-ribbon domain-containing OB-fold protein [Frankia sp. Cas4]